MNSLETLADRDETPRVLVVDDEPQILTALGDLLEDDYEVFTAESAEAALAVLRAQPVSVIVSDQRMPGMAGDDFLAEARRLSAASRILLTGYADLDAVTRAVNDGQIYGYLSKPWDPAHLRLMVDRAVEHCALLEELHRERDLLHHFMAYVPDWVIFKGPDRRYLRINATAAQGLGVSSPAEAVGRRLEEFVCSSYSQFSAAEDERLLRCGESLIAVDRLIRFSDGREHWYSVTKVPMRDAAGRVCGLIVVMRDIQERHATEARLRESEARLTEAQRVARIGSWTFELAERRVDWSDEVCRIFECEPDRASGSGRAFHDVVHPEDRPAVKGILERVWRGEPYELEHRLRMADGRVKWVHGRGEVVRDEGGRPERVLCTVQDVTARKEAELALQALTEELEARVEARTEDLRKAHDDVRAKQEELGALVDHLADCVVTVDERGTVLGANPAVEVVLGYRCEELVGRKVSELLPQLRGLDSSRGLTGGFSPLGARIVGGGLEVEGRRKDGRSVFLELGVNEYRVRDEPFFTIVLRDFSERKRFIAELNEAREEAEAANRAKSAFLAAMSHEIRTPMNGVVGMADLLLRDELTEAQADRARTLRDSGYALLAIIDDILDFSKIEAGRLELERVPFSLLELAESVADTLGPVAGRGAVDLSVFVDPGLPAQVHGDPTRLRQVLFNLAGNAVKFSRGSEERRGRVRIRVAAGGGPRCVQIAVADNGIGMAPESLERVFEAFTQAESSTTRRFGGSGLGLAISHRLVRMMGGELTVDSELGTGSTFRLTMPLEASRPTALPRFHDLGGLECIVVDGPYHAPDDLRAYLEHAGARVSVVPDLPAARARARTVEAPVVIHDVESAAPAIRTEIAAPGARYVLLTRGQRQGPRVHSPDVVQLDAEGVRMRSLLHAVAIAAGRVAPPDEDTEATGAIPAGVAARDRLGVEEARARGALILVAEDHVINRKVILQQIHELGLAAEVAGDGAEALARWRSGGYALLLADLHMPVMDGYELARAIRSEESGATRLPIIALTANALRGEEARCRAAGFDDFLPKPVPLERLERTVRQWLPRREEPLAPASVAGEPTVLDPTVLAALVGNDPATVRELLAEYLDSAAGSSAELRAAWASRDLGCVSGAAHKLKSASRAAGAEALAELCEELEAAGRAGEGRAVARLMTRFDRCMEAVTAEGSRLLAEDGPPAESAA